MKVKNYKDYACFDYTPYLDINEKPMKTPPKGCPYDLGDVVVIIKTKAIGVVLGTICEDGDLRTDAEGMQCWSSPGYLRLATSADIRNSKLSRSDRLNQELNKSQTKPKVSKNETTTVFVVVTTYNDGEQEIFPDVILITPSETKARNLVRKINKREPIKGFDYSKLSEFTGASYFTRPLDSISTWAFIKYSTI